jgi:hypothetical protein
MQKQRKELTVALLFKDIKIAQKISAELRKFSIFGHFYQDLDQFWVDIKTDKPDLAVVDIQMMSQEEIRLKNHPMIQSNELPLAFYYSQDSEVLLNSTFSIFHFGTIKEELDLTSQVKLLLDRRDEYLSLKEDAEILRQRVSRLRKRNAEIIADIFDIKNVTHGQKLALKIGQEVEKNLSSTSYTESVAQVFGNWPEIKSYSIYELNEGKDRLINTNTTSSKYSALPNLFLGERTESGITSFAVDMVTQVARDIMGSQLKVLKINGQSQDVRNLIVVDAKEESLEGFSWELLEFLLSGLYARTLINREETTAVRDEVSAWDLMSLVDQIQKDKKDSHYRVAHISFHQLNETVKKNPTNRFYWRAFHKEFSAEVNKLVGDKAISGFFGTKSFLAVLPNEIAEPVYNRLRAFSDKFPFYRFFEESALVVSKQLKPQIRLITPGAANALRHIDQEYSQLDSAIELASARAAEIMSRTEV